MSKYTLDDFTWGYGKGAGQVAPTGLLKILNELAEGQEVPNNFKPHKKDCCELWGACSCVSCDCWQLDAAQRKARSKETTSPKEPTINFITPRSPKETWEKEYLSREEAYQKGRKEVIEEVKEWFNQKGNFHVKELLTRLEKNHE